VERRQAQLVALWETGSGLVAGLLVSIVAVPQTTIAVLVGLMKVTAGIAFVALKLLATAVWAGLSTLTFAFRPPRRRQRRWYEGVMWGRVASFLGVIIILALVIVAPTGGGNIITKSLGWPDYGFFQTKETMVNIFTEWAGIGRNDVGPLPGTSEVKLTLVKMTLLWHLQDWHGILDMEETAILAARALVLPTSGRQDRAEAVYYWLGLANERLAQQLSLLGVDVRESITTRRGLWSSTSNNSPSLKSMAVEHRKPRHTAI
jgi:hypothetical protein